MAFTGPIDDLEVYTEDVVRQTARMTNELQSSIDATLEAAKKLITPRLALAAAITAGSADNAELAAFRKRIRQKANERTMAGILALLSKLSGDTLNGAGNGTIVVCTKAANGTLTEVAPTAAIVTELGKFTL